MAATSTPNNGSSIRTESSRKEIQAAIAKAVELRAIHAALIQGTSPTNQGLFTSSPPSSLSRPPLLHLPAHDYPVFTPSYEDEAITEYGGGEQYGSRMMQSDYMRENGSSRKELDSHFQIDQDARSVTSSCTNHITVLQTSPTAEALRSRRRNSLGDFKSVSSCNNCRISVNDVDNIPLTDSHMAVNPQQPKSKGTVFSRLFPRLKKKPNSLVEMESEEALKKELLDANQKRDAALAEVAEMKSSFGDLRKKLELLEGYCEELKIALRQTQQRSLKTNMPVSEEVMAEGFIQIVSEARLSVKQFCKLLIGQVEEKDVQLINNLNSLLQPYKVCLTSKYSKSVSLHLEGIINQTLYQDFENCVFQKNGSPKLLDPQQDRQAKFSSFVALRNLSWNEVIRKGTKYYSEEFSRYCDQKMSCIMSSLKWMRAWPEELLQSFFVAAKCVWLLHLLAFSFSPPLGILRVEENRAFDAGYMEELATEKQRGVQGRSQVKILVMPGFYVEDKIVRCKVVCNHKSVA